MAQTNSNDEEKFIPILSDVVWRFHAYGQYGKDRNKAIKALVRRAPGYSAEHYGERFDLHLRLLIATIEAVQEAPKYFKPENIYSDFSDVDQDYVMDRLHATFPGQTDEYLKRHVGMVIYWYYLR